MNTQASGIYKITNNITGKFYIGSAVDIKDRWKHHKKQLRGNYHNNKHLQRSWIKYGEANFIFEILECNVSIDRLLEREQYWLDSTKCYEESIGYNIAKNAESPMLGRSHSKETVDKIRTGNIGKKANDNVKKTASLTHKGKTISEEVRGKMSNSAKEFWTDDKRKTQSEKLKEVFESNPDIILRRAESQRGRKVTDEHKRIISDNKKGSKHHNTKLTEEIVREIKIMLMNNVPRKEISERFSTSYVVIAKIARGERWSHVQI